MSQAEVLDGGWHELETDYWRNSDPSGYPSIAFWFDGNAVAMLGGKNVQYAGADNSSYWKGGPAGLRPSLTTKLGAIEWIGTLNAGIPRLVR